MVNEKQQSDEQALEGGQAQNNAEGSDVVREALTVIYGDAKTYESMLKLLQASAKNIVQGASDAAIMVMEKVNTNSGGLNMEQVKELIPVVVSTMMELSEKAGFAQISGDHLKSAVGLTFKNWAKKHPDQIDQNQVQDMIQSESGQKAMNQIQPGQQQEVPADNQGLLGA